MKLEGKVTTGMGKGAMYMSMVEYQETFQKKLGFQPFPGTLNLEVEEEKRKEFEEKGDTLEIREIYHNGERVSNIDVTPCEINGFECGLLRLEFTDHPLSIAEIVAPVELREELGLSDGDNVLVQH